jgi:uncharacterized protein YciI
MRPPRLSLIWRNGHWTSCRSNKVDLAMIDAEMRTHIAWLRTHYAARTFLASGRKVPRDGGVILAIGHDGANAIEFARMLHPPNRVPTGSRPYSGPYFSETP